MNHGTYGDVLVGRSYIVPTGIYRAFVKYAPDDGSPMLNLNDPHLTYNLSGQVLLSAEDVNDAGWIVEDGDSRGYILVPQPLAAQ